MEGDDEYVDNKKGREGIDKTILPPSLFLSHSVIVIQNNKVSNYSRTF